MCVFHGDEYVDHIQKSSRNEDINREMEKIVCCYLYNRNQLVPQFETKTKETNSSKKHILCQGKF